MEKEDTRHWTLSRNGEFSVKACMSLFREENLEVRDWRKVWSLKAPSKILFFLWVACRKQLPTLDYLQKRGMCPPNVCVPYATKTRKGLIIFSSIARFLRNLEPHYEGSGGGLGVSSQYVGFIDSLAY